MYSDRSRPDIQLRFRAIHEEDFPSIIELVDTPDELFLAFPAAHWPLDFRQLKRLGEERMDLTVACINERAVAFSNLYGVQTGHHAFIGNLVIHRDFRGVGLGRAMLTHMLKLLTEKHRLDEARISVFSSNRVALKLYRSMGFVVYEEVSGTGPDGAPVVLLHMRRPLPCGRVRAP